MREAIISIRMHDPLLREASQQAESTGTSLEDWLLSLAAERIREAQVTARFFSRVPQESDGRRLMEILDHAGNNPPDPGDELPESYAPLQHRL